MNVTLKLTMDGLIEALRWKALERHATKDDGRPVKPDRTETSEPAGSANDGK